MRIDTGQHLRIDQRMKLAPRMIQSMEILQMSSQELEERIEQELSSNPTLELREPGADAKELESRRVQADRDSSEGERPLVMGDAAPDKSQADDFERLTNMSEEMGDTWDNSNYETGESFRPARDTGERDKKQEALANTASRPQSLADQLLDQWSMVEVPRDIAQCGEYLIGFIDDDGYLRTPLETLLQKAPEGITAELIEKTIPALQQGLEPIGLAARDIRECLLLQIDAAQRASQAPVRSVHHDHRGVQSDGRGNGQGHGHGSDAGPYAQRDDGAASTGAPSSPTPNSELRTPDSLAIERAIVSDYLKDVEVNRLPKIAKALGVDVERVKQAIVNLRQFHPHPGRTLIDEHPRAITPDAIIEFDEDQDRYVARLFNGRLPSVHISPQYLKLARDVRQDRKTREFIGNNIRSSRWLLDAIQQRQHTLLRVINVVLEAQREFFDFGPQALRPLPMTQVADQLGIHVATVSRAVNGKYLQCPRGIFPLRQFFSGGTETSSGEEVSWEAIRSKVQEIVDQEDKAEPLSDDQLVLKLKEHGIDIARRTIAKYRSELKIPTARQRRVY